MKDRDVLKEIAEIRSLMRGSSARMGRSAGWLFIVWGIIWACGFIATQFFGDASRFVWPALNLLGIGVTAVLVRRFFGKRGPQRVPGLGSRITLVFIGTTVFDILLALLFGFTTGEEITLLLILTAGLAYFVAGIVGPKRSIFLGVLLWCAAVLGKVVAPSYLPLIVAAVGGGAFLFTGISFLLARDGA